MLSEAIPLTVVGGYLGAGKTTLVNHLLRHPGGRRIGVIVNDFGSLAIDADLLADAAGDDVISLPNGCVCCTVGAGLHETLDSMARRDLDQIVIEVSGVADPAAAAAWGTVPPFEPGGVIVLADTTAVIARSRDTYVGSEVRRQLAGADLVAVTKVDLCPPAAVAEVRMWLAEVTGGAPMVDVCAGEVPSDVILGLRPGRVAGADVGPAGMAGRVGHDDRYATWSWTSSEALTRGALDGWLEAMAPSVLRVKGVVMLDDGPVVVDRVGRRVDIVPARRAPEVSQLVAIGLRSDEPDPPDPFLLHPG